MPTHCFDILLQKKFPRDLPAVIVAFGDDNFLRRESVFRILSHAKVDPEIARSFDGEECAWIDVHDELATLSLFSEDERRIAIVNSADKLVKDARVQLEKWLAKPAASSLLVLQLSSFPSNTKLYKSADKNGWCVQCSLPTSRPRSKTPDLKKLKEWIKNWSETELELKLSSTQVNQIMDAVGTDCGLLHQELSKLSLYTDESGKLSEDAMRENMGTWRTRTMWDIADAIADGNAADAMLQLEKVFAAGEHPAAVIPQVAWSLRRFGRAAHLILQGYRTGVRVPAAAAIGQCGFWGPDAKKAEARLKRMGLRRASMLSQWLLELDLKIKGSHSQPARAIFALEELCLKFAK